MFAVQLDSQLFLLAQTAAPLALAVGLGAIVIAAVVVGFAWAVHAYALRTGKRELAAYKEQVVALSDKIDALKERHKILPFINKSFTAPMSGETLAAYNDVAARLELHRREWLKLMDVWEQAQTLLESERILGNSRARAARRNIRAAAAPKQIETLLKDCETPLDRIEKAHETAAQDAKRFQQEDELLSRPLALLSQAALSIAPYQAGRSAAALLVEQTQGLLPGDPLAAIRRLEDACAKISELTRRATKMLEHAHTCGDLDKQITGIEQTAIERRAQGFLLREEGVDPDPLLAGAKRQRAGAWEAMNRADETAAGAAISQAISLADQARQTIERHVAAKSRCDAEIPVRRDAARRLTDLAVLARSKHAELERDFAAESWMSVAQNTRHAEAAITAAQQAIDEAAQSASPSVQHYLAACQQLNQAAERQKHAEADLSAVDKVLRELTELRGACRAQINNLCSAADRVHRLLQSNVADRAQANERFRAARASLERLSEQSRLPRPDWTQLTTAARQIEAELEGSEKLALKDIQLNQQAAAEIAEAERLIQEAAGFHEHGLTPDVSAARAQLAQARGSFAAQGYEEAIRLAHAATQAARAAHQDAVAQVQRHHQELESQRRAQQAAEAAPASGARPTYAELPAEAEEPALTQAREV